MHLVKMGQVPHGSNTSQSSYNEGFQTKSGYNFELVLFPPQCWQSPTCNCPSLHRVQGKKRRKKCIVLVGFQLRCNNLCSNHYQLKVIIHSDKLVKDTSYKSEDDTKRSKEEMKHAGFYPRYLKEYVYVYHRKLLSPFRDPLLCPSLRLLLHLALLLCTSIVAPA